MRVYLNGCGERKKRGRALRVPLQTGLLAGILLATFLFSAACPAVVIGWTPDGVGVCTAAYYQRSPR
jgi:hypothetical protein